MRTLAITSALLVMLAATAHADEEAEEKADEKEVAVKEPVKVPQPRKWSVELGPSLWAASVATTIELGPIELHRNVSFAQIAQYLDGGMSGALEARYGRFTTAGSFQYGQLATSKEIADGMGEIAGSLTTVLVEGAVGYMVLGGPDARLSFEPRAGFRYNSLDLEGMGTLGIGGTTVSAEGGLQRKGTDYLVGARGRLRLHPRVALITTGDTRIAGDSYSTWSISGDIRVRATRWLSVSAGWRVLETEQTPMTIRRNGPQLVVLVGF